MSSEPGTAFERRFPSRAEDLGRVTEEAVAFVENLGLDAQAVYLVNLTIEEMGTNILKYGYDDSDTHEILLRLEFPPGQVLLTLEDDGHEFNPLTAAEPDVNLSAEDRIPGGLGIHLVRKLAEAMAYERRDARNRLTVTLRR